MAREIEQPLKQLGLGGEFSQLFPSLEPPISPEGTRSPLEFTLDISHLTEETALALIAGEFLRLEDRLYRGGKQLTAEHKIIFLTGGNSEDVRRAKDMYGYPIYTKEADHAKAAECAEALRAISDHQEREPNIPNVLSEIADVYYNIIHLTALDPEFREVYKTCLARLSDSLGLSLHHATLLVIAKFKYRLIDNKGKKDIPGEIEMLGRLLDQQDEAAPLIPTPTDEQFDEAYNIIGEMMNTILKPRLVQWQTLELWKRRGVVSD